MKRLIFILPFLIFSNLIVAQNLFTQEGANWKEISCGNWTNMVGHYNVDKLRIDGDTTFNGIAYKKLYITFEDFKYASYTSQATDSLVSSTDQFFGGIRVDSQKLYIAAASYDISMDEKLIFDFSAQANDTIQIWFETMGYYSVVVDAVSSITVADGSVRNKLTLKEVSTGNPLPIFWIEGIGSNLGFLSSHYVYISDLSKSLRCAKSDVSVVYDYQPSSYFYCSVYPMQDCEFSTAAVDEIDQSINVIISPNPMSDFATLKFENLSNEMFNVDIYDLKGKRMSTLSNISNNQVQIEREDLSAGLYIVRLYSVNQTAFIGKLLVE